MKVRATSGAGVQLLSAERLVQLAPFAPIALMVCAGVIWGLALRGIDIRGMNDLGLVSVLPPAAMVAIGMLNVAFCLALNQRPLRGPVLLLHCVVLILILFGTPTLVAEEPRFHVAWRHVGITEYIARRGFVNTKINAYFSWPGFFILAAFLTKITGLPSSLTFVPWAPVFFNLLYLPPLLMIFRAATRDRRLVWLAVWLFYLTNWIGQDYFAPQALGYFLYLVILGVVCQWFRPSANERSGLWGYVRQFGPLARWAPKLERWVGSTEPASTPTRSFQRVGLIALIVVLGIVLAATHQITPFFVLIAVTLLVLFNRCSARGLPILLAVVTLAWISFMTTSFLAGHIHDLVGSVGEVSKTVDQSVVRRVRGSPEHVFIVRMRLLMSLVLGLAAAAGGLRRLLSGFRDLSMVLLTLAPCVMVAFMPYGGEMFLRIYLFTLPALAFFAAALFYPTPNPRPSWKTAALVTTATLVFAGGFLFTRYGNERMDTFTHGEINALRHLYEIAPPNSLLVAGTENLPWKAERLEEYRTDTITRAIRTGDIQAVAHKLSNRQHAMAYLILTRSQPYFAESIRGVPRSAWDQFEQTLKASKQFRLIYSNPDAQIYIFVKEPRRGY